MKKNYPALKKFAPLFFLFFAFSSFKKSVTKTRFIALLVFVVFSFKGNAQYTITGPTVNSSTINCATLLTSGYTTIYVGDGVNPTNFVMNNNLNFTCLGAIQLIVRNNANIDFSDGNYDLDLAANSSIIVEDGGNISAGTNCSASDLISIGGVNVASCNGNGQGNIISFPTIVTNGGYNTVNATSTVICGSGTSTITAVKNPTPTSSTIYRLYTVATGGSPIIPNGTKTISSSPYVATFTTPSISSTTNYYVEAETGGITTPRRQVVVTVTPTNTVTASTPQTLCINTTLTNITHSTTGATNIGAATNLPAGVTAAWAANVITISGTPTASGTFNYSIPLTGGCGAVNATGTITVTANMTSTASTPQTRCINTALSPNLTHTTTGATGIGAATNLPTGVTAAWAAKVITISGTPTASGTFNYSIPLTGGCGTVNATGTITVNALPTIPTLSAVTQPTCTTATGSFTITNYDASYSYAVTPSTGVTISGNTITGPTGSYTVTSTLASCISSASASVVINAQPSITTWNGTSDNNWNNAANWSCGGVPTISTDVLIPFPIASGKFPSISVGDPEGFVGDLEIQNGASITIEGVTNILTGTGTGNALTISGILTLNGIIDLNGESQLLQLTNNIISGTGTIEIDQQGTGNSFRYNYWSSPVNSRGTKFTIDEVLRDGNGGTLINKNITYGPAYAFADGAVTPQIKLSTYWMYVLRNSGSGYAAWFRVGNTGEVSVGEGYTMKGSNTSAAIQNYIFVGKPNNGDITLPLNAGFEYLVGNPYPSALNAAQFLWDNKNSIAGGALYFWEHYGGDTHNLAGYQAGYAARNITGGTPATSPSSVSNVVASGVIKKIPGPSIAVGQAFFVVGDADGGNIVFNNSQREFVMESSGNAVFMKTNNTKSKTVSNLGADLRPKFRIGFDAPKISHRQILLGIDERATNGVDWGFDAEIFEIFADDMYWMLDGKKYVIQGTNAIGLNSEVPLGIQLSKTGVVTVKIDALENVDDDTFIYLKDKLTGEFFNMKDKPVQLNLTAGKYADRFALIFKTPKLVEEEVIVEVLIPTTSEPIIEGIHVFMNKAMKELQIKNNSDDEILSVALINAVGQTVKTWNSNFNIRTISLPLNIATGVYLVQINTKTGKTVKKISVE